MAPASEVTPNSIPSVAFEPLLNALILPTVVGSGEVHRRVDGGAIPSRRALFCQLVQRHIRSWLTHTTSNRLDVVSEGSIKCSLSVVHPSAVRSER